MKLSVLFCGLALAVLPCSSALADPVIFDFSFSGPFFSGSGTFTTNSLGSGEYQITDVSGNVGGTAIDKLLDPGTYPLGLFEVPNDNLLFFPGSWGINSPSYFDAAGVSFQVGTNHSAYDVNLNDTWFFENAVAGSWNITEPDSITISLANPSGNPTSNPTVPEPSSLLLMGTGILAAAGAVRRRLAV